MASAQSAHLKKVGWLGLAGIYAENSGAERKRTAFSATLKGVFMDGGIVW